MRLTGAYFCKETSAGGFRRPCPDRAQSTDDPINYDLVRIDVEAVVPSLRCSRPNDMDQADFGEAPACTGRCVARTSKA